MISMCDGKSRMNSQGRENDLICSICCVVTFCSMWNHALRTHCRFDNPRHARLHNWCAHSEFITNFHEHITVRNDCSDLGTKKKRRRCASLKPAYHNVDQLIGGKQPQHHPARDTEAVCKEDYRPSTNNAEDLAICSWRVELGIE